MNQLALLGLVNPHLHQSQILEFTQDFNALSQFHPQTIAFERHINSSNALSDYAFYFRLPEFWKIQHDPITRRLGIAKYVSMVRKDKLGSISRSNPEQIEGFWIEKDASKHLRLRQLTYAYVNKYFNLKSFLPRIRFTGSDLDLDRLLHKYIFDMPSSIRQIGIVSCAGLSIGLKLVFSMNLDDFYALSTPRHSLRVIDLYKRIFPAHHILLHIGLLRGSVHSVYVELLTPEEERFSSQVKWRQLFDELEVNIDTEELYGFIETSDCYMLAGINHVKLPVYKKRQSQSNRLDMKVYSGVMLKNKVLEELS